MSEAGFAPNVIPFNPLQTRIPIGGGPAPEVYTFCFWGWSQFLYCIRWEITGGIVPGRTGDFNRRQLRRLWAGGVGGMFAFGIMKKGCEPWDIHFVKLLLP